MCQTGVFRLLSEVGLLANAQVLDNYLRQRAKQNGATVHNGLFMRMEQVRDASASPTVSLHASVCCRCKVEVHPTLQQPVEIVSVSCKHGQPLSDHILVA